MTQPGKTRVRKPRIPLVSSPNTRSPHDYVLGIDEVATGSWAGSFVVAAVLLPREGQLSCVKDSKKTSKDYRKVAVPLIHEAALYSEVIMVSRDRVEALGSQSAWREAIYSLVQNFSTHVGGASTGPSLKNTLIIIDGSPEGKLQSRLLTQIPAWYQFIPKADAKYYAVAAASILAKYAKDQEMEEIHKIYPEYNFISNAGYGTPEHKAALEKYGMTHFHKPLVKGLGYEYRE